MKIKTWHLLIGSAFIWGCARVTRADPAKLDTPIEGGAGEPLPPPDLYVFAHDRELIPLLLAAARRIENASGIKIHVNERDTITTAIPVFQSEFLCASGVDGRLHRGHGYLALALDCDAPAEQVIVHELIHMLGVDHLALPLKGIMNAKADNPTLNITEDDLNALCAVRACTKFEPEPAV